MAGHLDSLNARRAPRQWPLGVFIAVIWVCWDMTAKALLENRLVAGPEHVRELTPGLDLLLSYDRPIWPIGSLIGTAAACVVLFLLLFKVRRALLAIGISAGLGGFLGDLIDQWPDQQLTHFLRIHPAGVAMPAFNFSEVGITICALVLTWETLAWFSRRRLGRSSGHG